MNDYRFESPARTSQGHFLPFDKVENINPAASGMFDSRGKPVPSRLNEFAVVQSRSPVIENPNERSDAGTSASTGLKVSLISPHLVTPHKCRGRQRTASYLVACVPPCADHAAFHDLHAELLKLRLVAGGESAMCFRVD